MFGFPSARYWTASFTDETRKENPGHKRNGIVQLSATLLLLRVNVDGETMAIQSPCYSGRQLYPHDEAVKGGGGDLAALPFWRASGNDMQPTRDDGKKNRRIWQKGTELLGGQKQRHRYRRGSGPSRLGAPRE